MCCTDCYREKEMQEFIKYTNSMMGYLGLVSLFICLSVAGLQLWHPKSFFEKKKMISLSIFALFGFFSIYGCKVEIKIYKFSKTFQIACASIIIFGVF